MTLEERCENLAREIVNQCYNVSMEAMTARFAQELKAAYQQGYRYSYDYNQSVFDQTDRQTMALLVGKLIMQGYDNPGKYANIDERIEEAIGTAEKIIKRSGEIVMQRQMRERPLGGWG